MSIRDRLFTRDIADAAAERRDRVREEARERETRPAPAPVASTGPDSEEERHREPVTAVDPAPGVARAADQASAEAHALFPGDEAGGFRSRWDAIQTGFVDEPRVAVEQADELVAQVVTRLAEVFSRGRSQLEQQWDRGDSISTEDLRLALKRYRSFFDRLLSV
jgi:hypothetical protein